MNRNCGLSLLCLMAILYGIDCSSDAPVAGTEIRNGNCVGTIYNLDGSAADSAVVRLIPMDYNAYVQTGRPIDSTFTNSKGDYSFDVTESKLYNIVAEKGSTSCLRDSIFVQIEAKTLIKNDTLRESGRLSGTVNLKPGDDSRQTIILILGTNVYMVPSDTTGRFTSPPLPQGSYTFQTFTMLPGYAIFDTVINLHSGEVTSVSVSLPSSNAPTIQQLSATYDSATMFISLAWKKPDSSKIVSYALYRKTTLQSRDTMFLIDKAATTFTDDVVGFDGDSVSYEIAGIGANYKEGYRSATQPLGVCGIVYCSKKSDLTRVAAGLFNMQDISVFSERENEIYLVGEQGIFKLDSNGNVKKDYRLDLANGEYHFLTGNLQSDGAGHLSISKFNNHDTVTLLTFDRDLNVLSRRPFYCGRIVFDRDLNTMIQKYLPNQTFEILSDGTLYAFNAPIRYGVAAASGEWGTSITVYDSAFSTKRNFSIADRAICGTRRFGDTLVTYEYHNDQTPFDRPLKIHFYDKAFTPLSIAAPMDSCPKAWRNPRFETVVRFNGFLAVQSGVFVSIFNSLNVNEYNSALLVFTNANGDLLCRIVLPLPDFSFDSHGNIYTMTYENSSMKTLNTYTMKSLLRKLVQ